MNSLYTLCLIVVAGVCFYAGYIVGEKRAFYNLDVVAVAKPTPEAVVVAAPVEEIPAPVVVNEVAEVKVDPATEAMLTDHDHSLRAANRVITFTDIQGRQLSAEVIEAQAGGLKIRRTADQQVLTLPNTMLCEADQAFAAYLWKTSDKKTAEPKTLESDKAWEELFKGFE
ncbi:MAG: hypothetical protein ACSHX4_02000 [Opitutaceae bacterium]